MDLSKEDANGATMDEVGGAGPSGTSNDDTHVEELVSVVAAKQKQGNANYGWVPNMQAIMEILLSHLARAT